MDWSKIIILAVVQGLTEFLPISSSGHLVIAEHLLGMETNLTALNIFLHAGTLGSILVFYHRDIIKLLCEDRRALLLLGVGTLPAIAVGLGIEALSLKHFIEMPLVAGAMLPITGLMLVWMVGRDGKFEYGKLTYKQALLIGLFQAVAIMPGISRSGATIAAGLLVGLKRPAAATFSFLLAIPAITLGTANETRKLIRDWPDEMRLDMLAVGMAISFAVGLLALWLVVRMLHQGRLFWFAFWCIPLGLAVVVWQVSQWM